MAPLTDDGLPGQPGANLPTADIDPPDPAGTVPLSPSVRQLRAAYLEPGQPRYLAMRAAFESAHGKLVEESYAQVIAAAVVLVRGKAGYKIRLDYDSGRAPSAELAAILRELRLAEREKSALLQKKAQQIFAQKIYTLISHLFAVWDSISTPGPTGRAGEQLNDAVAAAKTELKSATGYADAAAHKSALTWYLWGLPIGALIGGLIIVAIWTFPRIFAGQEEINVSSQVGLSLAFGAVGAIVSVMVRITRGTNVDVRQPGRTITLGSASGGRRTRSCRAPRRWPPPPTASSRRRGSGLRRRSRPGCGACR